MGGASDEIGSQPFLIHDDLSGFLCSKGHWLYNNISCFWFQFKKTDTIENLNDALLLTSAFLFASGIGAFSYPPQQPQGRYSIHIHSMPIFFALGDFFPTICQESFRVSI